MDIYKWTVSGYGSCERMVEMVHHLQLVNLDSRFGNYRLGKSNGLDIT